MLLSYCWLTKNALSTKPDAAVKQALGGLGPIHNFPSPTSPAGNSHIGEKNVSEASPKVTEHAGPESEDVTAEQATQCLDDAPESQSIVDRPMSYLRSGVEHTGGEIVVEALRLAGVSRLYGIPGVQNLALYNAICSPPEAAKLFSGILFFYHSFWFLGSYYSTMKPSKVKRTNILL